MALIHRSRTTDDGRDADRLEQTALGAEGKRSRLVIAKQITGQLAQPVTPRRALQRRIGGEILPVETRRGISAVQAGNYCPYLLAPM